MLPGNTVDPKTASGLTSSTVDEIYLCGLSDKRNPTGAQV